jgi:leader peptidase (prepilin peptidase)/N-methyltransferase
MAAAVILVFTVIAVVVSGLLGEPQWWGLVAGGLLGPVIAGFLARFMAPKNVEPTESSHAGEQPSDLWIQYPHARREMLKEVAFLGPCAGLGAVGGVAFQAAVTSGVLPSTPPLWLLVLTGVLMGYLIGGGIVWAVRIFGSLAFGKEAMGLGDVHLMAAVGACLGWIDSTLAFFLAAFVGVYWTIVSMVWSGGQVRRAMPFGPYLAAATVLVLLGKPLIEQGLTVLFQVPAGQPPINLP